MEKTKRWLSFLLALALVAGMLPQITLHASASDVGYSENFYDYDMGAYLSFYSLGCNLHPTGKHFISNVEFVKTISTVYGEGLYFRYLSYCYKCDKFVSGEEVFTYKYGSLCSESGTEDDPIYLYGMNIPENVVKIVKKSDCDEPAEHESHFVTVWGFGNGWHEYSCVLCSSEAILDNEKCAWYLDNTGKYCSVCGKLYVKAEDPTGKDMSTNDVAIYALPGSGAGSLMTFVSLACNTHPNAKNTIVGTPTYRAVQEQLENDGAYVTRFYVDYEVDCTACGKVVHGSDVLQTYKLGICYKAYASPLYVNGTKSTNSILSIVKGNGLDHWYYNHFPAYVNDGEGTHHLDCMLCSFRGVTWECSGTATCTERAVCNYCGVPFGSVDPNNHKATGDPISENGKHYYECANGCGQRAKETECSGGTATCTKRAVCDTCGGEYGSLDSSNHAPAASWSAANGKHYKVCTNGCGTKLEMTACSGGTATCVKVANCDTCNQAYGSVDPNNHKAASTWTTENGKHYKVCTYGCGTKLEEAQCSGGTATCYDKAKCDTCGVEYGKPAGHTGGVATCLEKGVCTRCGEAYQGIDSKNHASSETYEVYYSVMEHRVYHSCCDSLVGYYKHSPAEGQEATCQSLAVCADCGESYGYMDYTNHTSDELTYRFSLKYDNVVNSPWDYDEHRVYHACCGTRAANEAHTPGELIWEGTEKVSQYCTTCQGKIGEALIHINGMETDENGMEASSAVYNGEQFFTVVDSLGVVAPTGTDDQWDVTVTQNGEEANIAPVHPGTYTVTCTRNGLTLTKDFTIEKRPLHIATILLSEVDEETGAAQLSTVFFDKIRNDEVYVPLDSGLTCTLEGTTPGKEYTQIYGLNLTEDMIQGEDKDNYVFISDPDGNYTVESYFIDRITLYITADYQDGEEMDYEAYTVEGLRKGHTISGIALELDEEDGTVYVNTDNLVILDADGNDVTALYTWDGTVTSGKFYKTHAGHKFNAYGFCATGECEAFKAPGVLHDEWGDVVYQIANAGQLYWFADRVNTIENYAEAVLTADIEVPEDAPNWVPIGGYEAWTPYTGAFDGQNHTISGLHCVTEGNYAGLFGYTDYNNRIKNIGVINSHFEGAKYVGGLIGCGYTTVSNCFVLDTTVISGSHEVAGLIGYNGGELYNSFTNGDDVCGAGYGTVENCFYLSEEETEDGGRTAGQFTSGQVACELQAGVPSEDIYDDDWNWVETITPHVWGQTIGTDVYPTLGGQKVYYGYNGCKDAEPVYSNDASAAQEKLAHSFGADSICDECGCVCTHNDIVDDQCLICGHEMLRITQQPVSYVGAVNDDVTFIVEATGSGLTYQWFYSTDGETWAKSYSPGYQTNTLAPILRSHRDGNMYKCVVSDAFGNSVESEAVSMTVKASEILIVSQTQSVVNAVVGQLYGFSVVAEGDNLTYRWELSTDGGETWQDSWNGGYTTPNLSVRMAPNRDGNMYRCRITSGLKVVAYSEAVMLDMQDPSVNLVGQSGNVFVTAGTTATFAVEAEGMDLTYTWYRSNDKGATWIQTYLSGYNTNTLSFAANANRAAMYMCKITDGSGTVIWSSPVKLQILSAELKILTQPVSLTCANGETASFTVEAQGDTLKYRWYASADGESWTATYLTGYNTETLSFDVNASRAAKIYKCVITDAAGNRIETDTVSVDLM